MAIYARRYGLISLALSFALPTSVSFANHVLPPANPEQSCPSAHAAGALSLEYAITDSAGRSYQDGDIVEGNVGLTFHLGGKTEGGFCQQRLRMTPAAECEAAWTLNQNVSSMEVWAETPTVSGRIGQIRWLTTARYPVMDTHNANTSGPASTTLDGDQYNTPRIYTYRLKLIVEATACDLAPTTFEKTVSFFSLPTPQKDLGCRRGEELVGNPCHTKIGNKYQAETDIAGPVLPVIRHYNSGLMKDLFGLGHGWTTNYHKQLERLSGTVIRARRGDGAGLPFTKVNGVWQRDLDSQATLTEDGTGFTLLTEDKTTERYDLAGRMEYETDRWGKTLTYSRNAAGQVALVMDTYGRSLEFAYLGGSLSQISHSGGSLVSYSYDIHDNLTTATYADGATRTYHYEDPKYIYALTGITDELGARWGTYAYDSTGRATSTEHTGGTDRYVLGFNADGTTTVTDPLGVSRTYTFTKKQNVHKVTSISGPPCDKCGGASFVYDANGNRTKKTDFNGVVTTYQFNSRNLETSRTEAYGTALARTITTAWHAIYPVPTQIDEPGKRTTFAYDVNGNRLSESIRDTATNESRTTSYSYVAGGLVGSIDGPRTDVNDFTNYTYDVQGNLTTITNALGHVTQFTLHNEHGQPTRIVDANGVVTLLVYDARQRLVTSSTGGAVTSFIYNDAGLLARVTKPGGSYIEYGYDAAHRVTDVLDSGGNKIHYTLDIVGNPTKEEVFDSYGQVTRRQSQEYDVLGRLYRDLNAAGQIVSQYSYDSRGTRTSQVDAGSFTTTYIPDVFKRVKQVTDAGGGVIAYGYNARDQLTSVTDPKNLTTSYSVNALGDVKQQVSPDTGTTTFTYDSAGNLRTRLDARGVSVSYNYDALNRLIQVDYPGSAEDVYYTYDGGNYSGPTPYGLGRLTGIADQSGSKKISYNPEGRVTSEVRTVNGVSEETAYSYDVDGNITGVWYPSGTTLTYGMDALGRIQNVQAVVQGTAVTVATNIAYSPEGQIQSYIAGNGIAVSRAYDLNGRPWQLQDQGVQHLTLSYDLRGNIVGIDDLVVPSRAQTFSYDPMSRLSTASGGYGSQSFNYDPSGNRTSKTSVPLSGPSVTNTYQYPSGSHRLASVTGTGGMTLSYSPVGNVVAAGQLTATYNYANRLGSSTQNGVSTSNAYSDQGLRTSKASAYPGGFTDAWDFSYDLKGRLLSERNRTSGDWREVVYLNGLPIALLNSGSSAPSVAFLHTDIQGTPLKATNAMGQVTWSPLRDPFGNAAPTIDDVPLRFPGQYFDADTGLHQNWHRDYDPNTGRYLQSDPYGLGDGVTTYSYVSNNPLRYIDPLGLMKLPGSPSGLPGGWQPDPSHRDPSGERWRHPSGDYVDFHKGRPGEPGWRGKDHWHHNGDKKHLQPGDEVPDPPADGGESACGDDCQETVAAVAAGAGGTYLAYRCARMLLSAPPPLWWTIPANVAAP